MKKTLLLSMAAVLVWASAARAADATLYETYSRAAQVKIFVETPVDESAKKDVDPAALKTAIEAALKGRKSIRFDVVADKAQAELVLTSRISERLWTPNDPVDMLVGVGATAMDAAIQEPYARMEGDFAVADAKSGKTLWKDELKATITKAGMTEADSYQMIREDMAKVLVQTAFGKKKSSRGAGR